MKNEEKREKNNQSNSANKYPKIKLHEPQVTSWKVTQPKMRQKSPFFSFECTFRNPEGDKNEIWKNVGFELSMLGGMTREPSGCLQLRVVY